MIDPLAEIVTHLQPSARHSKLVVGAGDWHINRSDSGEPFYGLLLEGTCCLVVDGHEPIELREGDFILIPEAYDVAMSSCIPFSDGVPESLPLAVATGEFRIGNQDGPIDLRILVGHCSFGSPDVNLLVPLLPQIMHVRGEPRLVALVELIRNEYRNRRPAREFILAHLLEIVLIEALRLTSGPLSSPGLVRGLADERLAAPIRRMHESPSTSWSIAKLAKEAAMSRSAFFDRFSREVGLSPMEYLTLWRMALAKKMLKKNDVSITDIAKHVGYGSASAFSVAFTRHVGLSPSRYARKLITPDILDSRT